MARILIVEDNQDMSDLMRESLQLDGHDIVCAWSGKELIEALSKEIPDLILLDIMLPDESGLTLMSKIREHTDSPVIVVSGRNDPVDKSIGLEMGADDYLGKPFQMRELSARVKAQLRRVPKTQLAHQTAAAPKTLKTANHIKFGAWILDRPRLQVFDADGASAGLTVKEVQLLETFISAPNRVLSREQLLEMSRSYGFNVTDRAIDTQIVRIRKKLGDSDQIIKSVRGAGYIFMQTPEVLPT